jgi:hypothetical protein
MPETPATARTIVTTPAPSSLRGLLSAPRFLVRLSPITAPLGTWGTASRRDTSHRVARCEGGDAMVGESTPETCEHGTGLAHGGPQEPPAHRFARLVAVAARCAGPPCGLRGRPLRWRHERQKGHSQTTQPKAATPASSAHSTSTRQLGSSQSTRPPTTRPRTASTQRASVTSSAPGGARSLSRAAKPTSASSPTSTVPKKKER